MEETAPDTPRESSLICEHFRLWRVRGESPFTVGAVDVPRLVVCIDGAGHVEHGGAAYAVEKGNVLLIPAAIGRCIFRPRGAVNVLEIALPD